MTVPTVTPFRTDPEMGVCFHGMWNAYTDEQRLALLTQMSAANIHLVRMDVSWAMLQPTDAASFDPWGVGFVDRVINMINGAGLTPLVMFWLTPGWANGGKGERTLPDDPADYARAAQWAARRWAGKVAGWEVWNEPNQDEFMTGKDPAAYARLLKAAYPAFKAGDPVAPVVFGGVAYNDDGWLAQAYAAGAHGSFDVMATHPYMGVANLSPITLDDGTIWTLAHAAAVRKLMVANGDADKPLWFTEFGWSTHGNVGNEQNWLLGVTEAQQADYLTATLALVRATMPWVGKVFWYTERDSTAESNAHNSHYGLIRADRSAKPSLAAAQRATVPVAAPPPGDPGAGYLLTFKGAAGAAYQNNPSRARVLLDRLPAAERARALTAATTLVVLAREATT